MGRVFLGNAVEFWWNPVSLMTGGLSLRYVSGLVGGFGECSRGGCGWMVAWLGIVFGTR